MCSEVAGDEVEDRKLVICKDGVRKAAKMALNR